MSDDSTIAVGSPEEDSETAVPVEAGDTGAVPRLQPTRTSDAALTFEETRSFTGRYGGRLVVLMGEAEAGKTTLWVEIWTQMMSAGQIAGVEFAGSVTSLAFEERCHESRLEAGLGRGDTVRTRPESDGLLHLRVRTPRCEMLEFFVSDYAGEHFQRVREGTPLLDELPWIGRADRLAVVVDGSAYSQLQSREVTLNNVSRQLHALRASGAVAESARVAIVLTKLDQVTGDALTAYAEDEAELQGLARLIDDSAATLRVAARPEGSSTAVGLEGLVEWMCSADRDISGSTPTLPFAERAMERFLA